MGHGQRWPRFSSERPGEGSGPLGAFSGWGQQRGIHRMTVVATHSRKVKSRPPLCPSRSISSFASPLVDLKPHPPLASSAPRSEEHTSELQSLRHLVCRLLLGKK